MTDNGGRLNFSGLVEAIKQVHEHCASQAGKAINVSLTLRNWVIGCYILEYEQRGADRADYGERLLESLSDRLRHVGMSRVEPRELRRYRQFYVVYSRFWESLTPELRRLSSGIGLPVPEIRDSVSPEFALAGATLITSLSFTHLKELIAIDDPLQRAFYEVECIRGNWSVRELKRQIGSLYFERSGLSKDKVKLAAREGWRRDFPTWTTSSSSRSTSSNYRVARRSNGLLRPRSESTAKYQVPEILPCVSELRIPRFSRRCARQIFADETNGSLTSWLRMGSIHPAAKIPRGADDMANAEGWKNHMYSNGNNK